MPKASYDSPGDRSQFLKERETNCKILCDAAPLGIFVYSKDGQVLGANQFLLNMLGSPPLKATKQINLFAFENLKRSGMSDFLAGALECGTPQQMEISYTSKWGKTSFVAIIAVPLAEDNSVPEKAIAFVQDITAQKKTQDRLLKSEMRFQLLAFSRKSKRFIQTVEVHQLIDDLVEILKRTLDRKISVRCRKKAHSSAVEGDPGQIRQVLMNLCINAKDAMSEDGRLVLTTETVEMDEAFCGGHDGLLPEVLSGDEC